MPFACELESGGLVFIETKEAAGQTEIFTSDKGIKYVRGTTNKLVPYDPEITFEADDDLRDDDLTIEFTPDDWATDGKVGFETVIDEAETELSESHDLGADEPLEDAELVDLHGNPIWLKEVEEADGGEVFDSNYPEQGEEIEEDAQYNDDPAQGTEDGDFFPEAA